MRPITKGAAAGAFLGAVVAAGVVYGREPTWWPSWAPGFWAWTSSDWSAFGTCATVLVALIAAGYARNTVEEARRLRREQAQPYVAVYMEQSPASATIIDLVIKNFGTTVAKDVRICITPAPQRGAEPGEEPESLGLPEVIPDLVPGQEWRTLWDSSHTHFEQGLPDRYEAVINFRDSQNHQLEPTRATLDWGAHKGRYYVEVLGVHQIAKSLRELNSTTKKWTEKGSGGLAVWPHDVRARDERRIATRDAWLASRQPSEAGPEAAPDG